MTPAGITSSREEFAAAADGLTSTVWLFVGLTRLPGLAGLIDGVVVGVFGTMMLLVPRGTNRGVERKKGPGALGCAGVAAGGAGTGAGVGAGPGCAYNPRPVISNKANEMIFA